MQSMRPLIVVDVSDPRALLEPLANALFHNGPAVLPRPGGAQIIATAPLEVPLDTAVVIETSGTTGAPKRVALSATALIASAEAAQEALGGAGQWLLALPAHYIAGVQVFTRSLLSKTTPLWLHPEAFSTRALAAKKAELEELAAGKPTYTSLVPAQLRRILDDAPVLPELDQMMKNFDRILVGGQAMPVDVVTRAEHAGYRVTRTYGSSETAGGCVWDQVPLGDTRVEVLEGRLAVAGSVLAQGYLEDPERTATSFIHKEGTRWYLSDDAGFVDSTGLVHVQGRVDDVIVSGGKKVSLAAVEKIIHQECGASDAVVVAGDHPEWGQVPIVVSSAPIDLVRARLVVKKILGAEARPDRIVKLDRIPHLGSGKPDRLLITDLVRRGQ